MIQRPTHTLFNHGKVLTPNTQPGDKAGCSATVCAVAEIAAASGSLASLFNFHLLQHGAFGPGRLLACTVAEIKATSKRSLLKAYAHLEYNITSY